MLFKPNYSQHIDIAGLSRASAIGHAMSVEKRARLKSYCATANALKMGVGLPHAPSLDALSMWARETGRVQSFIYQYYQKENQ